MHTNGQRSTHNVLRSILGSDQSLHRIGGRETLAHLLWQPVPGGLQQAAPAVREGTPWHSRALRCAFRYSVFNLYSTPESSTAEQGRVRLREEEQPQTGARCGSNLALPTAQIVRKVEAETYASLQAPNARYCAAA